MEFVVRPWLLVTLAACSFEHGIAPSNGDPDGGGSADPDASVNPPMIDAAMAGPIDAAIDAPAACADDDSDGVCNAVDDWPCGVKPTAPPTSVTMTGNGGKTSITVSNVSLDQTGRMAVATPSENLSLAFSYSILDTACPGNCIDQIEIGWVPGGRVGCPFDDAVPKGSTITGNIATSIRAPATPQVYDLRINLGQNYSCTYNGASGWWGSTPAANRTIAKLCVH